MVRFNYDKYNPYCSQYRIDNDDDNNEPDWLRQFQVTDRVEQRHQELIKERRQALRERVRRIRQGAKVDQSSSVQELARKRQRKASDMMKSLSLYNFLMMD